MKTVQFAIPEGATILQMETAVKGYEATLRGLVAEAMPDQESLMCAVRAMLGPQPGLVATMASVLVMRAWLTVQEAKKLED